MLTTAPEVAPPTGGHHVIDQYCTYQKLLGFSTATIKRRRNTLENLQRFIAPTPLNQAGGPDIEHWLGTKKAARTRHAYLSDLRQFFSWATKRALVETDPSIQIGSIKVPKSLPRPFGDDVTVLLEHGALPIRQRVALGLYAGMRCAEIANLRGEDLSLHSNPPAGVIRGGKGGKDRAVALHADAVRLLRDAPREGPLFPGRNGACVTPGTVSMSIRRHLQRCGLTGVPHQLRHTFGTEAARRSNGDMLVIADLMGHTSAETTKGYCQLTATRGADIIAKMFQPNDAA